MSDGNERKDQSSDGRKPTLTLNRTQSGGTVKQSFSHGRSKQVAVEVKTRRTVTPPAGGAAPAAPAAPPRPPQGAPASAAAAPPRPTAAAPAQPAQTPRPGGAPQAGARSSGRPSGAAGPAAAGNRPRDITAEELRRRQEAVQRSLAEQQARLERQRQEEAQRRAREEAERRLQEEEEARQRQLAEQRQAEADAAAQAARAAEAAASPAPQPSREEIAARADTGGDSAGPAPIGAAAPDRQANLLAELGGRVKKAKVAAPAPAKPARDKNAEGRRTGKLTLDMVERIAEGDDEKVRSLAAMRRAREKERERRMRGMGGGQEQAQKRDVVIPEAITVQELASRMATRAADVIKYLMRQGTMATINDVLDPDTAELIATDFGHVVKRVAESDVEEGLSGEEDRDEDLAPRPPVVTVMGHVDHGKTSLLDALRQTDVAAGEAGGITQHIGAYQVRLPTGQRVSFLDTPGHAAFSAMRSRGAQVTDIVILVVAADDGVMPQTVEAISHAKAAGVPIIVAVNKIDKPDADPRRVLNELLQHDIVTESVGGDVQAVEVSALQKLGLDDLVEAILVQAEVLDLKANPDRPAEAVVIESKLDRGRGAVATVLVKRGTLKRGDILVAGAQWGRVRALTNERGQQVTGAGPAEPVEVMGLEGVPDPGDPVVVVESENRAREIVEYRQRKRRDKSAAPAQARTSLEQMMAKFKSDEAKELAVVVKADVQGSAEAIQSALERMSTDEVRCRVIHSAVGAINESDIVLAKASGAPIIGFNVRASKEARELAEKENVEIRYYAIIYDVIDDVKGVMSGMLAPIERETPLGEATILQVFNISRIGRVAGCLVREGKMVRGQRVRLLRDNVVIHEGGKLNTLQRFKDSVNEVQTGQECGMSFENYQDIKEGDVIECYSLEVVQRTL